MAGEWKNAAIADVAIRVTKGTTPTTIGGQFVDQGINFVKVESITNDGRIDTDKLAHIDEATNALLSRSVLEQDDILFTIAGTIGRVALVPPSVLPANTNQAVAIVRPKPKEVLPRFLYYVLRDESRVRQAHTRVVQSVQANFSLGELGSLEIPLPPLPEQRAIACILGSLDDKIELNRRMNQTLEAMARAIFKSWFVDFDPVLAKASGQQPTGLARHITDLFPGGFVESEDGAVPTGWKIAGLHTVAALVKRSVKPMHALEKLWEHYSIPAFDAGRVPAVETGASINSVKYRVPVNCVLVSKLNPRFARVWLPDVRDEEAAICSTEFMPFVPLHDAWRPFLYELMKSDAVRRGIQERVTGSTGSRQRAKPEDVAVMHVVVPDPELIEAFGRSVGPLHEKALACISESRTLSPLRDSLLPKLISGELRVPDAERIVGRCL